MLDPGLLRDFMHRFFGYGSWDAKLWFVGMEEGGGDDLEEIARRLRAWDGSDELADLKAFHDEIHLEGTDWFRERPPIQTTWGKLIRAALIATGRNADTEGVRRYQRDELALRGGETALIELLPLPSPSTARWLYADAGIPSIATREMYRTEMLPIRIRVIGDRIKTHKPRAVIFYGLGYRAEWEQIIDQPFKSIDGERFLVAKNKNTTFVLAPHPTAQGVRNSDYEAIGRVIGRILEP